MSSGDDTEVILGASNSKRLSCRSFHLIPDLNLTFFVGDHLGIQVRIESMQIYDGLTSIVYNKSPIRLQHSNAFVFRSGYAYI